MKRLNILMGVVSLVTLLALAVICSLLRKADSLYRTGDYRGAMVFYSRLSGILPGSERLEFNVGTTLYRSGEYRKAAEHFAGILDHDGQRFRTAAAYNLGNSLFKQGDASAGTDRPGAVRCFREAMAQYARVEALDAGHEAARYNSAVAEKRLTVLLGSGREVDDHGRRNRSGGDNDRNQQRKDSLLQRESSRGKEGSVARTASATGTSPDSRPDQGHEKGSSRPMTRENAEALLQDHFRKREVKILLRNDDKPGLYTEVEKDW